MPDEDVQIGQAADGYGRVLWVPAIADVDDVLLSELTASGVIPLTYGLSPDGFRHETTVSTVTSGRYTLQQALELDGTITDTLELQYVYNRENPTEVEQAVTDGATGFVVHQLGYANETALAAGQKLNAVIPVKASIARDVPPTANTELMKVRKLNVTGKVGRESTISA